MIELIGDVTASATSAVEIPVVGTSSPSGASETASLRHFAEGDASSRLTANGDDEGERRSPNFGAMILCISDGIRPLKNRV